MRFNQVILMTIAMFGMLPFVMAGLNCQSYLPPHFLITRYPK